MAALEDKRPTELNAQSTVVVARLQFASFAFAFAFAHSHIRTKRVTRLNRPNRLNRLCRLCRSGQRRRAFGSADFRLYSPSLALCSELASQAWQTPSLSLSLPRADPASLTTPLPSRRPLLNNTNDDLRGLSQQDVASLRQYLSSSSIAATASASASASAAAVAVAVASPLNAMSTQHHRMPHPHHHHSHHHHHNASSNGGSGRGSSSNSSGSGSGSGSDDVQPRLYPLKCGALTPSTTHHASTTNDSGDSDGQPYPLPWYANRKAKQLSQKRSRAAAPSSNGCGAIIHNASSRSERAWIARGYPTEAVVPLAREFFNQPDAKDGRMPCGCEWHGVGCHHW